MKRNFQHKLVKVETQVVLQKKRCEQSPDILNHLALVAQLAELLRLIAGFVVFELSMVEKLYGSEQHIIGFDQLALWSFWTIDMVRRNDILVFFALQKHRVLLYFYTVSISKPQYSVKV